VASAPESSGGSYDFYLCANVNRDYVIGSKIVTVNGLFRLDTDGAWRHFGVNDTTLTALAVDPRDPDILYTTNLNGLWHSRDGGKNWRFANSWDMTEGQDVVVDPNAPDTVYLALPDGIAVSVDRADTLERRENGLPDRGKYTQALAVDRTTAGRVFAGTASGIYLTEDHAANWRQVLPTETTVNDIQQSPHDPAHWLAVTDTHGGWVSRDSGRSWQPIATLPSEHALYNVSFDPTDASRLAVGSWTYGIWTSEDGGETWTDRNAGLPDPHRVMRVGVNPDSGRLYASVFKATLYFSDDFGRTWKPEALEGSLVRKFVTVPRGEH
jgi:photosystem II stability/assembly factor-like uncharacterized protein